MGKESLGPTGRLDAVRPVKVNNLIDVKQLQDVFSKECIGECSCCQHQQIAMNGDIGCSLINDASRVEAVSKADYDDLYRKYCSLAEILNDKLPRILKMLDEL